MRLSLELDKYCLSLNMCSAGAHFLYAGISSSPLIRRCVCQRCGSPYTSCGPLWVPYVSSHRDYSSGATADVHKWRFPCDKAVSLLSQHLGSSDTRFSTLSKMIKKAPADSGDRELWRRLKGDAGGGGLNAAHLPPKTSAILGH